MIHMTIAGVGIGAGFPCRFVFEVSNAHNGHVENAHALIDGAKAAGADFVKFQAYTPDELVALRGDGPAPNPWGADGWTMRDLYTKAQTPLAWLPELFQHARDIGLVPFASVFGRTSLAACEAVQCPAYKVAALDNADRALREAVESTARPLLISMRREQRLALPTDAAFRADRQYLLCPEGYPQTPESFALDKEDFTGWRGWSGGNSPDFLGISSHCLEPLLPIAAVARGAKLIEMHGQLDTVPSELESNVSLTVSQFAAMVRAVRATEAMLATA
ncbi:MAG: N-acetylneuraminate synthase family protein [Phycisphaerales bacterium]